MRSGGSGCSSLFCTNSRGLVGAAFMTPVHLSLTCLLACLLTGVINAAPTSLPKKDLLALCKNLTSPSVIWPIDTYRNTRPRQKTFVNLGRVEYNSIVALGGS